MNKTAKNIAMLSCLGLVVGLGAVGLNSYANAAGNAGGTINMHRFMKPNAAQLGSFGSISAIDGSKITMQEKTKSGTTDYTVDASGATFTKNGNAATISDLSVGDMIMAKGTVSGNNVTATAISDGFGKGMDRAALGSFGTVTAIGDNTITMDEKTIDSTTSYTVDVSDATFTSKGAAATIADIKVGDKIMVQGTVSGTNVAATKVSLGCGKGMDRAGMGNVGSVISVDGSIVTMQAKTKSGDTTITIDASNATVTNNGATATIADLKAGDMIFVKGTVSGNSIAATSISFGETGKSGFHGFHRGNHSATNANTATS